VLDAPNQRGTAEMKCLVLGRSPGTAVEGVRHYVLFIRRSEEWKGVWCREGAGYLPERFLTSGGMEVDVS
jgi:hypothetical protein